MIKEKFEHLALLQDGWLDGEGIKPSTLSINLGINILSYLESNYLENCFVYPLSEEEGGISIEWFNSSFSITLDISSRGNIILNYLDLLNNNDEYITYENNELNTLILSKHVQKLIDKHTMLNI